MYKITNLISHRIFASGYFPDECVGGLSDLCIDAKIDNQVVYCDIEGLAKIKDQWYVLDECGNWAYLPDWYEVEIMDDE